MPVVTGSSNRRIGCWQELLTAWELSSSLQRAQLYSEVLDKFFDTEKDCVNAETESKRKQEAEAKEKENVENICKNMNFSDNIIDVSDGNKK